MFIQLSVPHLPAKNYECSFKFAKVIVKNLLASFCGHSVDIERHVTDTLADDRVYGRTKPARKHLVRHGCITYSEMLRMRA